MTVLEFQIKKEGAKSQYLWFDIPDSFTIGQLIALKDGVLAKANEESRVFVSFCFDASREDFPTETITSWEEYLNAA